MRRQLGATLFASFVIVAVAAPVSATPTAKKPVAPPPGWVVDRVRFEPLDSAPLGVDGLGDYRGAIEVARNGGSVAVVNQLGFEEYLLGLSEMPPRWPAEALKAQAIAARSYALFEMLTPQTSTWRAVNADICATDACQVYTGLKRERQESANAWAAAVSATAGQVLLYKGKPVMAEYSSSNGGQSITGGQPYLRAVNDPDDALSPLHHWQVSIPLDTIASAIPGPGQLVDAERPTPNTIFLTWQLPDSSTVQQPVSITDFRDHLNGLPAPSGLPDYVPSMRFSMVSDTSARVAQLDGAGWGHGVGMSQYGAMGKALRGMKADAILATYFGGLRPVAVPPTQFPQSIRVALDTSRSSATATSAGRFRVLDGTGRVLAVMGSGKWQVLPAPGKAGVRVVPPSAQGGPPAIESVAVNPGRPRPGAAVQLRFHLSTPAAVRVAMQRPESPAVELDAGVKDAGDHVVTLPASPVVGDVTVTISAEAGVGRDAAVPIGFRVDNKGTGLVAAVEGDAGGARSGTGLMGALIIAAIAGGLLQLRRRLH
ncbi:MAG: SpoIID/LytB domain-containing protein [Actinobacteria bacterium]|nr:SpoIID/LytB domain-containing protein [Actinomycetota bacterium]